MGPTMMRLLLAVITLAVAAAGQRVVPIGISRPLHKPPPIHKRASTWNQELVNNLTGGGYYAEVEVGTPGQKVSLILDTGSSDVWVLDEHADLCTSRAMQRAYGGCIATYNPDDSSTYELVDRNDFSISYLDGSGAVGDYIKDNLAIGGTVVEGLQMGLAENSTVNSGLLGIGFSANVAADTPYPNIMDRLQDQGLIGSKAYSLYLNDRFSSTGTILFGGLDTEKYIGQLTSVPIIADPRSATHTSFTVMLTSFTAMENDTLVTNFTRSPVPVILDSGTTLSYLPTAMSARLYTTLNAVDDVDKTGLVYIDCSYLDNTTLTFDFHFGDAGPQISVPVEELVLDNVREYVSLGLRLPAGLPFDDVCSFGIQPNEDVYLLGDTFLRSAYVVYDLDNQEIAMAQSNFNASRSNIVELARNQTQIPEATGVATGASATVSSTGQSTTGGDGGSSETGSGDQGETTENAAVRAVPAPDVRAVGVAGFVGVGMVLGGLLVVV